MKTLRNVTITLDEEVARWARVRAAEENSSVSRLDGILVVNPFERLPSTLSI